MQNGATNRRQWLQSVGFGGAAAIAVSAGLNVRSTSGQTAATHPIAAARRRSIRLAHLTDVHVKPERSADVGMADCLVHAQSQADKPELILLGGDCVFDSMAHDQTRTRQLWELWQKVLKDTCSLPIQPCIGNHDVFGWTQSKAKTTGKEPLYGKAWAMEMLGLSKSYHSFDKAGWHFVLLDSIFPDGDHYKGQLDEAQFQWLASDLANTPTNTPVLVMSHIPICSVTPMIDPKVMQGDTMPIKSATMHGDFHRIKDLFKRHSNIRLCLSGHTHLIDHVIYNGISYICDGAVSGDWWKGNHLGECDNGYGLLDLYDDGTFEHSYQTYGWHTQPGSDETMNSNARLWKPLA